jgi:opacity protein-like surface antigen
LRTTWLKKPLALAVILVGVLAATPAGAEWFADLEIGTALTHSGDVDSTSSGGTLTQFRDVEYDKSFTIGGRVGHWFEPGGRWNFGLAVNLFRFEPDITSQTVSGSSPLTGFTEIDVTALSLDLILKIPYRVGRLRPYATAGPALFFSTIKSQTNFGGASATDTSLGLKLGLGAYYAIRPKVDLFGEYRYTQFSIDAETTTGATSRSRLEMELTTSHLVLGLAYRF